MAARRRHGGHWESRYRGLLIALLVAWAAALSAGILVHLIWLDVMAIAGGALVCLLGAYTDDWWWTGIGPITYGTGEHAQVQPGKTVWDLLGLLIVPAALGLGLAWYNDQQQTAAERQKAQQQEAEMLKIQREQAMDTTLNSYLDYMTNLFLSTGLVSGHPGPPVKVAAQARTIAALRTLDSTRNRIITKFLADSHLYGSVRLSNADLANLSLFSSDLHDAHLENAILDNDHLEYANLRTAHLAGASLQGAHLYRTLLEGADLRGAHLPQAHLRAAFLANAQLQGASLAYADLTDAHLAGAHLDRHTILISVNWHHTECPDGTFSVSKHSGSQTCDGHLYLP